MRLVTVVEFAAFLAQVGKCIEPEECDDLIEYLARNPLEGDEISGTGGLRKLRWGGKGKGKRSGLRVIYYFYNEIAPIFLLAVYGKNVQADLTQEQKDRLATLVKALKKECNAMRKRS